MTLFTCQRAKTWSSGDGIALSSSQEYGSWLQDPDFQLTQLGGETAPGRSEVTTAIHVLMDFLGAASNDSASIKQSVLTEDLEPLMGIKGPVSPEAQPATPKSTRNRTQIKSARAHWAGPGQANTYGWSVEPYPSSIFLSTPDELAMGGDSAPGRRVKRLQQSLMLLCFSPGPWNFNTIWRRSEMSSMNGKARQTSLIADW